MFFGRKPNSDIEGFEVLPSTFEVDTNTLKNWRSSVEVMRATAKTNQEKAGDQMVKRHKNKQPPSQYKTGETVVFRCQISDNKILSKRRKFVVRTGVMMERKDDIYKLEGSNKGKEKEYKWVAVSTTTSTIREEERRKQQTAKDGAKSDDPVEYLPEHLSRQPESSNGKLTFSFVL